MASCDVGCAVPPPRYYNSCKECRLPEPVRHFLGGSDSPILQMAEEIALYHHENWDGTGYTPGLAGEEIPISGRVAAIADVFDALIHDRPYKKAWTLEAAVRWIVDQKGQKFDPEVVDAFLRTDP